ncbi:S-layer homology domain-containing protein [Brevibacillus sp. H7]|uniref:S-layer homology domain-containing protein n=1 Tax=Brevibacillus sp. H7 TaxID=3349138 RepID=UPI003806124D
MRRRLKPFRMLIIGMAVILGLLPASPTHAHSGVETTLSAFADIKGHWAAGEIGDMVQKGIVQGFPDGRFRPDQPITQEQFMTLVQRMLPSFPGREFDEYTRETYLSAVKGRWSEKAYTNLLAAGIIAYGKPDGKISRVEAARILLAALASQSEGEKYRGTKAQFFTDIHVSDEYEVITVYPIYKLGMMTGFPDGTFQPEGMLTRAQSVVLLKRLQQKIKELYPANVDASAKQAMIAAVKTFVEDVMDQRKIRRFDELVKYVQENKLPVSQKFLEEHFVFMKYEATDYISFPQFNELLYFARITDNKYRMTVQYYSGELGGSVDRTFYLSSQDGKAFQLIGKNE